LTVADGNVYFFFPPEDEPTSTPQKRNKLKSGTCRWILDPKAKRDISNPIYAHARIKASISWETSGEFSRVDDRFVTKKYNHFWQLRIDPTREYDFAACGPPAGGLFNCIAHYTWDDRAEDVYWLGPRSTVQEPAFIPKSNGGEAEGWLIALINRLHVLRNDIGIWDARNLAAGPVATIYLPFKLKMGLHGNFVDHADIEEWEKRRSKDGDVGPLKVAEVPLPWQMQNDATNGVNGRH
jgi:carotenoid cleavage dioxygenase